MYFFTFNRNFTRNLLLLLFLLLYMKNVSFKEIKKLASGHRASKYDKHLNILLYNNNFRLYET